MRDEDIFRKLKKEKPLVKRKDLQPLSRKDFEQKRSSFDMLVEEKSDKRAERRSGNYRTGAGAYQKTSERSGVRNTEEKPAREPEALSIPGDDEPRVQPPQPRTVQARSETRVRTGQEPVKQPEGRTFTMRTAGTPRPEPERVQPAAQELQNHLQEETQDTASRTITGPAAPQRESVQPTRPPEAPRGQSVETVKIPSPPPAREYAQPSQKRMANIREAYTKAEATELEIFNEAARGNRPAVQPDSLKVTPMRTRRTEFEEYYEPVQGGESAPPFRHEIKYYINYREYILLRNTLKALAQLDKYAGDSGEYRIRSLYFDDVYESALNQKLGGSDYRKKYRIRIYNFNDDVIKFEKKIKQGQFVTKKSIRLSRDEYERIIAGEYEFLLRRTEPLASELFLELKNNRLRPRVIVDYVREAYVYPFENIRITFDKDLHSGMWMTDIFDPNAPTMPMYEEGTMVLEVKFEKSLPAHIRGILNNIDAAERSAISKYVICRKFE